MKSVLCPVPLGYDIDFAPITLNYHEQWGDCGCPDGLNGEEIPIEVRNVMLVDKHDDLRRYLTASIGIYYSRLHVLGGLEKSYRELSSLEKRVCQKRQ